MGRRLDAEEAFDLYADARGVDLSWDEQSGRLVVGTRLGRSSLPRAELAAALSAANRELKLVGFRLEGDEVVFSLSAFLEDDSRISAAVIDRLILVTRIAVRTFGPRVVPPPPRRKLSPVVERRPGELDAVERGEIAAAVLRARPAIAPLLGRSLDVTELVQDFFPRRRILELAADANLALTFALTRSGEAELLTTQLDALNRIAAAELAPRADLEDETAARAYLEHATRWARPSLLEQRVDDGDPRVHPPRLAPHASGHQLVFFVRSEETLVRRTAVLSLDDASIALHDETLG